MVRTERLSTVFSDNTILFLTGKITHDNLIRVNKGNNILVLHFTESLDF